MLLRALGLIAIFSFLIYWFQVRQTPETMEAYHKLMHETYLEKTQKPLEVEPAYQQREGVEKEIWVGGHEKHFHIESKTSELSLSQSKRSLKASEKLQNLHCDLPGELTLSADEGSFAFPENQLDAKGHCHLTHLNNKIDGTHIQIDLENETIIYENAKGFLASGPFSFEADQLVWDKKKQHILLQSNVKIEQPGAFTIESDEGTLLLNHLKAEKLILEKNVRLVSSKVEDQLSYALADTMTYDPATKTILFSSQTKVLFWQDHLQLSAKEILIRDQKTVEGHGDVHFTFDLEEQNAMERFFKQYL
jgi:lipopolysaccharide export system protein LptA